MKIIVLSLLACVACGGTRSGPSDVTLEWSFGGEDCQLARVSSIDVVVDGADLSPFACLDTGGVAQALDLGLLAPGAHDVLLTGSDQAGAVIYQTEATLSVAGDRAPEDFTVDADPQFGHVAFSWDFAVPSGNPAAGCAEAGVASMQVAIDGVLASAGGSTDLPCSNAGVDGITLDVAPGIHNVSFSALSASGIVYGGANPVTVVALQDAVDADHLGTSEPVPFLGVTFLFQNGALDCEQAGLETIQVVVDPDIQPEVVGEVSCELGGGAIAKGAVFPVFSLSPRHTVGLIGLRNGAVVWTTPAPVAATFAPGTETDLVVDAEPVP